MRQLKQKRLGIYGLMALILLSCSCSLGFLAKGVEPSFDLRSCTPLESTTKRKNISVVSLGWHTGILISSTDVPDTLREEIAEFQKFPFAEIGWGDAEFYMSSGYSTSKALKAAFFSSGSAVHVVGFENKDEYLREASVVSLSLSRLGFEQLMEYFESRLARDAQGRVIPLGTALYGQGHFYAALGRTSVFHTCNSWTAEALIKSGCKISSNYIRASSLMKALRKLPKE